VAATGGAGTGPAGTVVMAGRSVIAGTDFGVLSRQLEQDEYVAFNVSWTPMPLTATDS
jgi:hypothetical protein